MNVPVWIITIGLITGGIFLLIQGIQLILKAISGPVLLELPLIQQSGQFVLVQAGEYAIWQVGRTIQRVAVKMAIPAIRAQQTGETVLMQPSFSRVRVNSGWEGRLLLFTFQAKAGQYVLELASMASPSDPESPYFLEIREHKPGYLLVFGILVVILAATCLIAGLILPFIGDNQTNRANF